jgi:hypothetical protein
MNNYLPYEEDGKYFKQDYDSSGSEQESQTS